MNINLLVQGLAADIAQAAQTTLPGEPGQEGAEFESMLRDQAAQSHEHRQPERTKDQKPADKKTAEKPQQSSAKEEEIPEDGQEVAAALVTSQPVVPFEFLAVPQGEAVEEGNVAVDAGSMAAPVLEQAAPVTAGTDSAPMQTEEVLPQAQQPVQEAANAQPQVQVQPEAGQQEAAEQPTQVQPEVEVPIHQQAVSHAMSQQPQVTEEERPEDVEILDAWIQEQPVFRQETTPVKVAENYDNDKTADLEFMNQVRDPVNQAIQQGQSSVQIQLSPANLGQVLVEITRNGDGSMSIVMTAATEKAANLLQQHSTALQHFVMDNVQAPVHIEVQQPEQPENANQFLNPEGQNRQHREQQQQEKKQKGSNEDFLQQLRLGLVGLDEV